jgi:hypothetical protein
VNIGSNGAEYGGDRIAFLRIHSVRITQPHRSQARGKSNHVEIVNGIGTAGFATDQMRLRFSRALLLSGKKPERTIRQTSMNWPTLGESLDKGEAIFRLDQAPSESRRSSKECRLSEQFCRSHQLAVSAAVLRCR